LDDMIEFGPIRSYPKRLNRTCFNSKKATTNHIVNINLA